MSIWTFLFSLLFGGAPSVELENLERLRTFLWGKDRFNVVDIDGKSYLILDLTLFYLNINVRPDNLLLIREEYISMYDTILADTHYQPIGEWRRSANLVTGQPGIGKTLFLLYVLARRLQEREPVALQVNSNEFALFNGHGVSLHSSESGNVPRGIWALSDSSGEHHGLCTAFEKPFPHVINTSLPASHRWKDWVKRLGARVHIMDVWSLEELRALLIIRNLNIQDGVALFHKFGPSPRTIINILITPAEEAEYVNYVQDGADAFVHDFPTAFFDLRKLNFSSSDISSKFFFVRPHVSNARGATLHIPTQFLTNALGAAMSHQAAAQQHTFFNILSGHPSLGSAAGWLFENYAHVCLSDPSRNALQAYLQNETNPQLIPAPAEIIAGNTALRNIKEPYDFYWQPRESNFPGIDAVIRKGNVVWALQLTTSDSHSPATEGLTEIYGMMKQTTNIEWYVVIVGPNRNKAESARDRQKLGGQWMNKSIYACELPLGKFTGSALQRLQNILHDSDLDVPMD